MTDKEKKNNESTEPVEQKIERRDITKELQESYLDYAMSVIVSRALPDVRDGLKPVQRRILWAMWDSGLKHSAKYRKSANVVGAVLGRYHPHGDVPVYEALARMAQDFSLRYPLIDGQGNWGSVDGDPPAAMRYTEAKLDKISEHLLTDIEKETVDWQPNYDATVQEPKYLPAKLPNLLLNGTVGIAVGMATSIPPHNLVELSDAIIHIIDNPEVTIKELMKFVPGPDFPTGGIIYDRKAIETAYTTGRGSVTMRGVANIEERKSGTFHIIITEIPFQVNKSTLIEKMAELVTEKKIDLIRDIRDESDRDGMRIVIDLKQDATPQKVLNQLYEYTELQKNFAFNMLALVQGLQPRVLSLKDILVHYIDHRKVVVRRRTEFDLRKAEERAHILEGLVKALDVIDKVIETIKKSQDKDDAKNNLIKKFGFSEAQAIAILEMRLQTLAALERNKLEDELKEKRVLIAELKDILAHPKKILGIIMTELNELKTSFSEPRRTKIVVSGLKDFNEEDLIPKEEVVITLSRDGYIKRMQPQVFKTQRRGGKGLIGSELKEEDSIMEFAAASSHDSALFFTNLGRVFQTKVYEIPAATRTSKGKSVHNFLEIPTNEQISAILTYATDQESFDLEKHYFVMATEQGVIKKTPIAEFQNVRRTGIVALTLQDKDVLRWVKISSGQDEVIVVTKKGQSIRFKEKDVRAMGRTAAGVKAIELRKGDAVAGLDVIEMANKEMLAKARILTIMSHGYGKQTPIKEYKIQRRGGSGVKTAKVTDKTGQVIAALIVDENVEEVIAFSVHGQALRTKLSDIRVAGRDTQGVKIMNLEKNDSLVGLVCL